jgi:two-component system phosphate regulon response regulator PhoB
MFKVLLIEDNDQTKILISSVVSGAQFFHASTLKEAEKSLSIEKIDLILLDIELPDGDGLGFLTKLNLNPNFSNIPVMIISGKTEISNKVMAFSFGAEDFISKPFDIVELKARIEAKLKKLSSSKIAQEEFNIGDLKINTSKQKVWLHRSNENISLDLTTLEFKLLIILSKHPEHVFTREVLLNEIWGNDTFVTDRSVDTHVAHLRKKINQSHCKIETVIGTGYRFIIGQL